MILRPDALALELVERGRERIHPHAVPVERNADDVDAEPRQPVDRALVAVLLDDDGVAAREQHAVDQIERLQRARREQDVVGRAGDARIGLELGDEELAQRPVALRAAVSAHRSRACAPRASTPIRRRRSARRAAPASGSLLPPVKSYLTRPVQRTAAGGRPGGQKGAKSKAMESSLEGEIARRTAQGRGDGRIRDARLISPRTAFRSRGSPAAAAGDTRKAISALAASGSLAFAAIPARNTLTICSSAGIGPTMSMPGCGRSSLTGWKPISACPRATTPGRPAHRDFCTACP